MDPSISRCQGKEWYLKGKVVVRGGTGTAQNEVGWNWKAIITCTVGPLSEYQWEGWAGNIVKLYTALGLRSRSQCKWDSSFGEKSPMTFFSM